ncbi:MAG: HAD-superfamily hydrolase, subfamily variant2 [Novosphingobium sp.]|nr:HAD-superfamily hydrolase, subfamily variant2 [Novosphingobium sp.]
MLEGPRPAWLTFDCYGTLIDYPAARAAAIEVARARHPDACIDPAETTRVFEARLAEMERQHPRRSFKRLATDAMSAALALQGVADGASDGRLLLDQIRGARPFPEAVAELSRLRQSGFRICIVSNSDDDLILESVGRLGHQIDRVITAERSGAYKPSPAMFRYAWEQLGVRYDDFVHVCASPQDDLVAAKSLGFRCVWIDRGGSGEPPAGFKPSLTLPTLLGLCDSLRHLI